MTLLSCFHVAPIPIYMIFFILLWNKKDVETDSLSHHSFSLHPSPHIETKWLLRRLPFWIMSHYVFHSSKKVKLFRKNLLVLENLFGSSKLFTTTGQKSQLRDETVVLWNCWTSLLKDSSWSVRYCKYKYGLLPNPLVISAKATEFKWP